MSARDFFFKKGEPMIWLAGTGLAVSLLLIFGLLTLVAVRGLGFFWPQPLVLIETADGKRVLGEILAREPVPEARDGGQRIRVKIANRDLNGLDFRWIEEKEIAKRDAPPNALLLERQEYGNFHGFLKELRRGDEAIGGSDAAGLARLEAEQARIRPVFEALRETEKKEVGAINAALERDRLAVRRAELRKDPGLEKLHAASAARQSELKRRYEDLRDRLESQRRDVRRREREEQGRPGPGPRADRRAERRVRLDEGGRLPLARP
jgi:phosphate transport system permease protein